MLMLKWPGALVIAGLLALPSTGSNAQSVIGQAKGVKPQAEGNVAGLLAPGSNVHESETIRTGSAGQTNLQFRDDSVLNVGPTSVIKLDKFVYDPKNKDRGLSLLRPRVAHSALLPASKTRARSRLNQVRDACIRGSSALLFPLA